MTKEGKFRLVEQALIRPDNRAVLLKSRKESKHVLRMHLSISAGNEDMVQIYKGSIQIKKNCIHHSLECLARNASAERHANKFEKVKGCGNSSFTHVVRGYQNLVVAPNRVNCRENVCTS